MTPATPIPVSVLTGFLGSGKTTLLGYLLRQPEFSRTAVIINEFGEIGLNHELIETSEDSVVALTTGCLCCKVRTDLTETLHDLLHRRDAGICTAFDRIAIETSGLADPAPILHALMTDTGLAGRLALDRVVTTVDVVTGERTLEREAISRKQVAVADRIVLSKLDLAGDPAASLLNRLATLNPGAPTLRAARGRIEAETLFGPALHGGKAGARDIDAWLGQAPQHVRHHHDAEIRTYTIVRTAPIQAVALTLLLDLGGALRWGSAASEGHRECRREPGPPGRDPRRAAHLPRPDVARTLAFGRSQEPHGFHHPPHPAALGRGVARCHRHRGHRSIEAGLAPGLSIDRTVPP
ncbi:MAG TPA: GTP-binding protein, partial [Steroidobacteraceae bacterium]